jgi:hypothetical protein
MLGKSKFSVILLVCGTACILPSLTLVMYMYHSHAAQLAESSRNLDSFAIFVGFPGAAGFIAGVVMAAVGVVIGIRDHHGGSAQ